MIGIFDSGAGGLTVVRQIFKYLPQYQIIYFGDVARLPYGTKGRNFVKRYSQKITEWLLRKKAKIIVVACHTSSAYAAHFLKREFKKIPIFEMITPAVEDVLRSAKNKKIGIIGTPGTIKSNAWQNELFKKDKELKIYSLACPLFVPLVEEGMIKGEIVQKIAEKYLRFLKGKKIDVLVLACTHYPLLEKTIRKIIGPKIKIVNPAESVAKKIKEFLKKNPKIEKSLKKGKKHSFFFSDEPYNLEKISYLSLRKKIIPKINDPF